MEIVNVSYLGTAQDTQTYSELDRNLINSNFINSAFGQPEDYIESFIYDLNDQIISRNYANVDYKIGSDVNPVNGLTSQITLDPERDVRDAGFDRGSVVVQYNFYRRLLESQAGRRFWIKEISPSRTEIKAARQDISNDDLSIAFDTFSATLAADAYYPDFYLNFGDSTEIIGVNAVYVEEDGVGYVLFKLYEPLPSEFDLKSQFWVVQKIAEPARFQVTIEVEAEPVANLFRLRGPNYDIDLNQSIGQTTPYYNYTNLFTTPVTSSLQQLKSYLDDQAVGINVDYSAFDNFIHFSSATERINNFVYKLRLIELYQSSSAALANIPAGTVTDQIVNTSTNTLQQNINNIISKFDPYEYYLYFSSASTAWPKANNTEPYLLYPVTSSQALAWLGSATTYPTATSLSVLYSASLYDNANSDGLRYTAPTYIREDEANEPYLVFLDMIGQHFDNIWLYYKDVTNRYVANNNPNVGISLDVVSEALKGFGMQLYTNTNLSDNIYYSLLGIGNEGSTLPLTSSAYAQIVIASSSLYPLAGQDWLSSSIYLPPFENEYLNRYVTVFETEQPNITSSFDQLSPNQVEQEIYKRLYHNLPYLLKTKGTERGVRALIACYGIPNATLSVNEFGGYNIFSQGDIQGIQDNKIYTGSQPELTEKLLSPFTTIQDYVNNVEINSPSIEVGFSPADSINADITSSLPSLNVQQLIGNPSLQYSSSYAPLQQVANAYFETNYTKGYNVWDFIRVIKFFNNSLFKMLQDFVPARASLTTGIIIKSHILERNKYARHEPTVTTSSLGDDIQMVTISGSDADEIKYSTAHTTYVSTPSGSVEIQNIYSFEKYNGEFGGTVLEVTNGEALSQDDYSVTANGTVLETINYGALFQNVTESVKSNRFFDLDYSTNQIAPVNYGIITKSINEGQAALTDPYAPLAQLQDYNYSLRRSVKPRYEGSETRSRLYNVYTGPSRTYVGDQSYGQTAAVDKIKLKYAYLVDIYTASAFLPNRSNAQIKYLIENDTTVLNLTKANFNLNDVQNIFKGGETCDISLFKYDEANAYTQLLANNPTLKVYEGGFRYLPILHNISGSATNHKYTLGEPIEVSVPAGGAPANISDFTPQITVYEDVKGGGTSDYYFTASIVATPAVAARTFVNFTWSIPNLSLNGTGTATIQSGQTTSNDVQIHVEYDYPSYDAFTNNVIEVSSISGGGTGATGSISTYYTTEVSSSTTCLFFNTSSRQLVFNNLIAQYSTTLGITFQSTSDTDWAGSGLDRVVLPFTLGVGDRVSVYDAASSLGWDERFEYTIASVALTGSGTAARLIATTVPDINTANFNSGSVDTTTNANFKACRYIVWKHVPDETNVILKYNPKDPTLVEKGLLFPQYLQEEVKKNAGNTIQTLTANNLISE